MKFLVMKFSQIDYFKLPLLTIVDWRYYVEKSNEIEEWADACTPGWIREGMILEFKTESDLIAFLLRWE